jgi:hypothetical protein
VSNPIPNVFVLVIVVGILETSSLCGTAAENRRLLLNDLIRSPPNETLPLHSGFLTLWNSGCALDVVSSLVYVFSSA